MTSVQLTRTWITNVVTREMLGLFTAPDRPQSYTAAGEVRVYGGGRMRGITKAGMSHTWKFELQEMTLAQVATLTGWVDDGVTVLVRDHRGQSMYGTFFQVDVTEQPAQTPTGAYYAAAITLQSVTVVEGE